MGRSEKRAPGARRVGKPRQIESRGAGDSRNMVMIFGGWTIMRCPRKHEWFELERGSVGREDAERLRRHAAECPACRSEADEVREVAADLERLAAETRAELSAEAAESVLRRGRVHGLVGRPFRRPLSVRLQRSRWVRIGVPLAAAVVGAVLIVYGLQLTGPQEVQPRGALARLVREAGTAVTMADLVELAPVARAAVGEELARPAPMPEQVSDLLLAAYICQRPRESRQTADLQFLANGAWARRCEEASRTASVQPPWLMLASAVIFRPIVAVATASGGTAPPTTDAMAVARFHVLGGDYADALRVLPADDNAAVLRAWCLEALGRPAEAVKVLAAAQAGDRTMMRILRADLALDSRDVAEAMRQFEVLAGDRDRYWFAAGYLYRYELADARGAGQCFQRVHDEHLAGYVSRMFRMELLAAREPQPAPLFAEDFDEYTVGQQPGNWALVMTRGSEFRVVEVTRGKALEQDEVNFSGAEFLTGPADWTDYTVQADVKVLASHGEYAVGVSAYRRADHTGYVLELSPGRLRIVEQFAAKGEPRRAASGRVERLLLEPVQAQVRLDEVPAVGWWYTVKLRVQRVAGGVCVAGKFWRTDTAEPLSWQVVWTDTGQAGVGPLAGGAAGVQISGAKVLIDNFLLTR